MMTSFCHQSADEEVGKFGKSGLGSRQGWGVLSPRWSLSPAPSSPPPLGAALGGDFNALSQLTLVSFSLNSIYIYVYVYNMYVVK